MKNGAGETPIIPDGMAKKLLGGAAGVFGLAADMARHVAWYVSYQAGRRPRDPR